MPPQQSRHPAHLRQKGVTIVPYGIEGGSGEGSYRPERKEMSPQSSSEYPKSALRTDPAALPHRYRSWLQHLE